MKYKNIIFDFGNVIGKFNGKYIMQQFCRSEEDCSLLCSVIYKKWGELDKGTLDYDEYIEECLTALPERLADPTRAFFKDWPRYITPKEETLHFIDELVERNVPVYLLSNAPTYFAEWARQYEVLKKFSGVVFSAPLKTAKPDPAMYQYLFRTYSLKPEECFFIDDLERNIEAGKSLGMDGIIFTGDIEEVKKAVEF
mgnify:FL=1